MYTVLFLNRNKSLKSWHKVSDLHFIKLNIYFFPDHAFLGFRPSQVAAACIAASRICLQISPSWTTMLHLLTGYSWDHLTQCIQLMLL